MGTTARLLTTMLSGAGLLVACGGTDQSSSSSGAAAAASSAPATAAAMPKPILMSSTVAGKGSVLVAGSNGMTVYTFAKDVAGSGTSNCTGGCITKWPAVTVPAGQTPTAGPGVSGKMTAITRTDGTLQCTYNGLPLYFFAGDKAPGDMNGNYTNWASVTLTP